MASNPEFLREGTALVDSFEPDRIVIGVESDWARDVLRRVYAPLTAKGHRLIETDIATAELAKHASNAFFALKISYANAIARICERADADVTSVADVMGSDPRIGDGPSSTPASATVATASRRTSRHSSAFRPGSGTGSR